MTSPRRSRAKWPKHLAHSDASDAVDDVLAVAQAIAKARATAGLTQAEVAERMRTTQSNVARMEGGRTTPSTRTLEKFAQAIGARLRINFEPVRTR